MKIAILGTRGIPASYGGFETFAEEVAKRMTRAGHTITVYGRKKFFTTVLDKKYLDINLINTPTIMHKYLETPLHSLTSFIDVLFFRDFDAIILCNAANSPFCWLSKIKRIKLLINVDGIERERKKWNSLGKLWYRIGEKCSVLFADHIIADAKVINEYYFQTYKKKTEIITYGADCISTPPGKILDKYNLKKDGYILYVSRLEPENNALGVIKAYRLSNIKLPLVIVGDAPYADKYKKQLHEESNENVIFTGFQFGDSYRELRTNCLMYIQATEVGGTHPALVEAMAFGNCIIANDVPEHREVLEDCGEYYDKNNFQMLADILLMLFNDKIRRENIAKKAKLLAEKKYSWDLVTEQYLKLICK